MGGNLSTFEKSGAVHDNRIVVVWKSPSKIRYATSTLLIATSKKSPFGRLYAETQSITDGLGVDQLTSAAIFEELYNMIRHISRSDFMQKLFHMNHQMMPYLANSVTHPYNWLGAGVIPESNWNDVWNGINSRQHTVVSGIAINNEEYSITIRIEKMSPKFEDFSSGQRIGPLPVPLDKSNAQVARLSDWAAAKDPKLQHNSQLWRFPPTLSSMLYGAWIIIQGPGNVRPMERTAQVAITPFSF